MHHHSRNQVKNCDTADEAAIARFVPALSALGAHCRNSTRKPPTSAALLLSIFIVLASTPHASAQQTSAPAAEDTGGLPQLSDFTPPYTCPWFFGRPASCNIPIKVSLECLDMRIIPADQLSRPFTDKELRNADRACELLPVWVDQDPRIVVVSREKSRLHIRYKISPSSKLFSSTRIYIDNTNFQIREAVDQANKPAAYFVQESLEEIGKRGYLP